MRIVTFEEFVVDYNEYYQCDLKVVRCNTNDIEEIIDNLYDNSDYEIDYDNEVIELY